jgi:hypothetical protein
MSSPFKGLVKSFLKGLVKSFLKGIVKSFKVLFKANKSVQLYCIVSKYKERAMKEYDDGRENGRGPQVLPLKSLIYPRLMCNLLPLEGTLRGHPPPPPSYDRKACTIPNTDSGAPRNQDLNDGHSRGMGSSIIMGF